MTYTMPTNVSDIGSFFRQTNTMIGGNLIAFMLLIMIFVITYTTFYAKFQSEKSFLYSSWVTMVSSFFITLIFDTSPAIIMLPIALLMVSFFMARN